MRGIERERDRHLAARHPALQLAKAATAADEIDPPVGARVADAEQWLDDIACQQRDRQAPDRIAFGHEIAPDGQPIPFPGKIHAKLAGCARTHPLV